MTKRVKNWIALLVVLLISIGGVAIMYNPATKKSNIKLGLDLRSGTHIALKLLETEDYMTGKKVQIDDAIVETAMDVFEKRLNPEGNKEIIVQREGNDRIIIEIPEEDAEEFTTVGSIVEYVESKIG